MQREATSHPQGKLRDRVHLAIGGQLLTLNRPPIELSLLSVLREKLGRKGTKEGCAEGDCGACCVTVATAGADGTVRYHSINACIQPIVNIDGCAVLTVEDLKSAEGGPGDLPKAFSACHASQCGFCTPGCLMAAAGTLAAPPSDGLLSRGAIADALSGNLCRCTGYRPIVDAIDDVQRQQATAAVFDHKAVSQTLARLDGLTVNPVGWTDDEGGRSVSVATSADALDRMFADEPSSVLVAGATDLGVRFNKGFFEPTDVILIGRIKELQGLRTDGDRLLIGALTPWSTLERELLAWYPEMGELMRRFASPLIRNVATIGGNLASGSPVGDAMPALMALGARLRLRCLGGSRTIELAEFYTGYRQTRLKPGEYIAAIEIPVLPQAQTWLRFYKLSKRFDQDISTLSAGIHLSVNAAGRYSDVRLAFGGMAATPRRATHAERALEGCLPGSASTLACLAALAEDFRPISDVRAPGCYRLEAAKGLLLRGLMACASDPPGATGVAGPWADGGIRTLMEVAHAA